MSDPHEVVDVDIAGTPGNRLTGRLTSLPTLGRRRIQELHPELELVVVQWQGPVRD
jgi:hypothetical protein